MNKLIPACAIAISILNCGQAQDLFHMPKESQSRTSTQENINGTKGQGGAANKGAKGNAFTNLKAGESKILLDITGSGVIDRMWFTFNNRSPEMLRSLRLQIFWDNASTPAVDAPFGDFFCTSLGHPVAFQSALFSNPEGRSFNCYIPMPFKTAAKITLTNKNETDLGLLFFDIDFQKTQARDSDELYFHTYWSRHETNPIGEDLELLPKVSGRGRFLGVSAGINVNPRYGQTWWGEGEVKMYFDGDSSMPTIVGTGAEDYIGTGWFEGFFAHSYQGCLLADPINHQYAFYRFHIPDPIWFYNSCKVTIQEIGGWFAPVVRDLQAQGVPLKPVSLYGQYGFRGLLEPSTPSDELENADSRDWLNFYRSDDYSVTAYYYLDRP